MVWPNRRNFLSFEVFTIPTDVESCFPPNAPFRYDSKQLINGFVFIFKFFFVLLFYIFSYFSFLYFCFVYFSSVGHELGEKD